MPCGQVKHCCSCCTSMIECCCLAAQHAGVSSSEKLQHGCPYTLGLLVTFFLVMCAQVTRTF